MNKIVKVAQVGLLLSLAVGAMGCASSSSASFLPTEARAQRSSEQRSVEVLLDQAPERPFKVVGELLGHTADNGRSIDAMKDRAAAAGLDGIYWIDCSSSCSGRCTAKGFVYTDVAQVAAR